MKHLQMVLLVMVTVTVGARSQEKQAAPAVSEASQACVECHEGLQPGLVADWRSSRHAITTPAKALLLPAVARRMSNENVPTDLRDTVVGCYECHGRNTDNHQDSFEHFGYRINVVVSPQDCRTCHLLEVEQYGGSKKAHALGNLQKNPVYHALVETITGVKEVQAGRITARPASENTKGETCYNCHGTEVTVAGTQTITTSLGEVEVPRLRNWPNQGVGRINPDGSLGACTTCHPRHSFSLEVARKPYTCSQCHLHPDVPAWEVFKESKHGNIYASLEHGYNWEEVPWRVGQDFRAPTCASCHNSLLTAPDGTVIVERSHDFGARLWVRLFGLIYAHPQPREGNTAGIRNQDGLPLPTTFSGQLASAFLIDAGEQSRRQGEMKQVCTACHGTSWAEGHFAQLDTAVLESNTMTLAATQLVQQAWDGKWADPANPFDEAIEKKWAEQWLFYANSVRYASAMSGQDYATFKNGWWELSKTLRDMHAALPAQAKSRK